MKRPGAEASAIWAGELFATPCVSGIIVVEMRIYVESTIPSYAVARPARDLLQAARQQLTRDWWEMRRERHELFTSQVVLDEIASGEPKMAEKRMELMAKIEFLDLTDEANALTKTIMGSGVLSLNAGRDAAHIALATVHEMDILLTWNCWHIANAFIQAKLRKLAEASRFVLPVICTPEELLEDNYEQDN